eukprot:scaffold12306_cov71-Phaeocystis_antarctica.AAC.1
MSSVGVSVTRLGLIFPQRSNAGAALRPAFSLDTPRGACLRDAACVPAMPPSYSCMEVMHGGRAAAATAPRSSTHAPACSAPSRSASRLALASSPRTKASLDTTHTDAAVYVPCSHAPPSCPQKVNQNSPLNPNHLCDLIALRRVYGGQ